MTNTESLKFIEETANAVCACYEQLGVLSITPGRQIFSNTDADGNGGRVMLYHPRFVELFGTDLKKIKLEIDRVLAGSNYPVTASIIIGRYEYAAIMSIEDAKRYFGAKTVRPLLKEDISKLMAELEADEK